MRVRPGSPEHGFDHLSSSLTSTVKLSAESSAVTTCLQSTNNSGQKKNQIPIYFWFQQLIGSDQWLTVDVQFLFSDPDPIKLNKVHHPADTKAALEAPAGSDSPATTCKVPQKQAAGPDLGKPAISAASPLSEHSSPAHVQLLNSAEDANEAQLHLPTTATSTKPSSEERFPSKLIQPAAEAAEPPKGGSGEHFAKTG